MDCVARSALLERGRQLGIVAGQSVIADTEEEMTLLFDLALYTAKPNRSRALDRYASAVAPLLKAEEARVLDAMQDCRSSRHGTLDGLANDSRLAISIYRTTIDEGVLNKVRFLDPDQLMPLTDQAPISNPASAAPIGAPVASW
jgi:hypothetical protein